MGASWLTLAALWAVLALRDAYRLAEGNLGGSFGIAAVLAAPALIFGTFGVRRLKLLPPGRGSRIFAVVAGVPAVLTAAAIGVVALTAGEVPEGWSAMLVLCSLVAGLCYWTNRLEALPQARPSQQENV
jgi:hypothetical protein